MIRYIVVSIVSGLLLGILVWFFRVVMGVAGQWMTFNVPVGTLTYSLVAGLAEMIILGIFYGLTLRPTIWQSAISK
jgi:hypothetical protein